MAGSEAEPELTKPPNSVGERRKADFNGRAMRYLKRFAVGVLLCLGIGATLGLRLLLAETNLDRNRGDYRSRMHPIWSGLPPGAADTTRLPLDFDSGVLRHLFSNEFEPEVPYLVAFPVPGTVHAPALLLLPGGGYSFRSEKLDGLDIAAWFAEHGVAAFVLDYRVDPYRYPVPLQDAQRALRWLRAHAGEQGIDAQRVGVFGTSAGGTLQDTSPQLQAHSSVESSSSRSEARGTMDPRGNKAPGASTALAPMRHWSPTTAPNLLQPVACSTPALRT